MALYGRLNVFNCFAGGKLAGNGVFLSTSYNLCVVSRSMHSAQCVFNAYRYAMAEPLPKSVQNKRREQPAEGKAKY